MKLIWPSFLDEFPLLIVTLILYLRLMFVPACAAVIISTSVKTALAGFRLLPPPAPGSGVFAWRDRAGAGRTAY